jgi:small subunit ribosomal protein S13
LARIAGVDLPKGKRIEIALTYIYGIGRSVSQKILTEADVDWNTKSDDLTEGQVTSIRRIIDEKYKVEGDLRRDLSMNIKRLMDLGAYRGLRRVPTREPGRDLAGRSWVRERNKLREENGQESEKGRQVQERKEERSNGYHPHSVHLQQHDRYRHRQ